jgi:hypothetical protein
VLGGPLFRPAAGTPRASGERNRLPWSALVPPEAGPGTRRSRCGGLSLHRTRGAGRVSRRSVFALPGASPRDTIPSPRPPLLPPSICTILYCRFLRTAASEFAASCSGRIAPGHQPLPSLRVATLSRQCCRQGVACLLRRTPPRALPAACRQPAVTGPTAVQARRSGTRWGRSQPIVPVGLTQPCIDLAGRCLAGRALPIPTLTSAGEWKARPRRSRPSPGGF